jgi:hypothetical protein
MAFGLFLFLVVLGVLIGTGQGKAMLKGLGALGIGILILLTPVWLILAYCLVWFIGIESYEALGPLGPITALLTPWAVASLWKRLTRPQPNNGALAQRLNRHEEQARRTGHKVGGNPSPTWGERIRKAPDLRKAYPVKRLSDCRGPHQ